MGREECARQAGLARGLALNRAMEEGENPLLSFFLYFFRLCFPPSFPFPGLKAADRTSVQNEWMEEKIPVIVATISFGMGVDKANVRCVRLCWAPPEPET